MSSGSPAFLNLQQGIGCKQWLRVVSSSRNLEAVEGESAGVEGSSRSIISVCSRSGNHE